MKKFKKLMKWLYRHTPWGACVVKKYQSIRRHYYITLNQAESACSIQALAMLRPVKFRIDQVKDRLY